MALSSVQNHADHMQMRKPRGTHIQHVLIACVWIYGRKQNRGLLRLRGVLPCVDSSVVVAVLRVEGKHMNRRGGEHHEVPIVGVEPLECMFCIRWAKHIHSPAD